MTHPYTPYSGPTLGDYQLHLDPTIEAELTALQSGTPSRRLRHLVLFPNWLSLQASTLDRILRTAPPAHTSPPIVPRGAYHGTPRAADVGDLMKALWGIPVVQQTATRAADQAAHRWRTLPTGGKVLLVTTTGLILGGTLAGILGNNQARTGAFNFIVNKNIPVPGLGSMSVRLHPRGAGATWGNIGGSGVTVSADAQAGGGLPTHVQFMVTFDVTRYLHHW